MSRRAAIQAQSAPGWAFAFTIAYVVLEYGRPQDALSILQALKLSMLVSLALALALLQNSHQVPWFRPQILGFTALLAYMTAWVPLATNNYWALKTLIVIAQTYLFVLSLATFVDSRERLRDFLVAFLLAGLFQAIWGTMNGGRGTGYFQGDENDFALTMCMVLPFALMTRPLLKGGRRNALCWITATACVVAVMASESRGGFVGLVVTAGTIVLFHPNRIRIGLTIVIGAGAMLLLGPAEYWEEMKTIFDQGGTREDRMRLWEIATAVFKDNPFFGVGPGNINWVLNDYQVFDPEVRRFGGRAVHSLFYTILPELGLVGSALFVWLLAYNARDLLRVIQTSKSNGPSPVASVSRAILCAMGAYLVCGLFISVLWYPHFYLLTGITVATARVIEREHEASRRAPISGPQPPAESPI
ncbi:O-antigen ligase family protein [Myxococcota bacterium]|nr:O-antigen ligase family protein [Myxococcota bacterium]